MSTVKESSLATQARLSQATTGIKPIIPVAPIPTVVQPKPAVPYQPQPTPAEAKKNAELVVPNQAQSTSNIHMDDAMLQKIALATTGTMKVIASEMKGLFLERENVIDSMFISLIAGHHVLLLGPPGTGKSALTKEFTRRITSARMFEWLLNRTSDPSEILGPISIKNMERDKFVRIIDNKIGDCEIAFLDEIFKCNEPTLNALLPILNERVLFNDGKAVPIPLQMMVAASNETPEEGEGLEALYDRILFKHWVDYIQDPTNRVQMMVNYNNSKNPTKAATIKRTAMDLKDIAVVQRCKDLVTIPASIIKDFNKLLIELSKKSIRFSDRKVNWCMDVIKASALYNGRTTATSDDINPLVYVLWERVEDISEIELQITKVIDPHTAKIKQWVGEANELLQEILTLHANDPKKAMEETLEAKTKISAVVAKIDKAISDAQREGKDINSFVSTRNKISDDLQDLMCKTLGIAPATFGANDGSGLFENN